MKIVYLIRNAIVMLSGSRHRQLLIMGISFLLFIMCLLGLFLREISNYDQRVINSLLAQGIDNTGMIYLEYYSEEDKEAQLELLHTLEEDERISAVGCLIEGMTLDGQRIPEIYDIWEEGYALSGDMPSNGYQDVITINIDKQLWNMFHLPLMAGENPDFYDMEWADWQQIAEGEAVQDIYLYLGYAYRGIPVGTTYCFTYTNGISYCVHVCGIFEEGTCMMTSMIDYNTSAANVSYTNMDYQVVEINLDENMNSRWLFSVDSSKCSMSQMMEEIYSLAQEYGVTISIGTIGAILDAKESESLILQKYINQIVIGLFLLAVSVVACIQAVDFISNRYQYGMFRVVGYTGTDIFIMLLVENVIRIVLPYVAAGVCTCLYVKVNPYMYMNEIKIMQYVVCRPGLAAVLLLVASSVILPVIFVRKSNIVEMLKDSQK